MELITNGTRMTAMTILSAEVIPASETTTTDAISSADFGKYYIASTGTGNNTIQIQFSFDGTTWFSPITATTAAAASSQQGDVIAPLCRVVVVNSVAGNNTMSAWIALQRTSC